MRKGLIAFIAVFFIAVVSMVIIFMKQSAVVAHKRSNEIMEQFKTIDRDLKKTDTRIDSLNKTGFDTLIKAN